MSEIPEDIEKAAHNAANGLPVGNNRQAIMAAIARAILAERKRCAEAARTVEGPEDGEYWIAARIAQAIEAGQ